jgi:hypothetical protein
MLQGRYKHEHRWHFLQVRSEAEDIAGTKTFIKKEYAYFVCHNCPDTDNEPNTIKRPVKGDEDAENSQES